MDVVEPRHRQLDQLLLSPEFLDNPYPVYDELRAEDPVHWCEPWNCWVLTRYADVEATFLDSHRFLNSGRFTSLMEQLPEPVREEIQPLEQHMLLGLISSDPPVHTRLRALVHKAFTPRAVAEMREQIQAIVDQHLDAVQDTGSMDLVRDLAYPLPVTVISSMLGIPPADREQFKQWSDDIMLFQATGRATPETMRFSQRALLAMRDYLSDIFAQRRRQPREDLISALVAAEEQGDRLTTGELLSTCVTLLVAGHGTTTNLIGNSMLALLRHPDQLQTLRDDTALIGVAVEEFLRYDTPLQRNRRVAATDLEFGGKQIKQGDLILQILGAANRDPEQFPEPHRLDIRRQPNRHIGFGKGIHFCVGAPLARLEAPIAINTILRRMPGLELAVDAVEWRHEHAVFRSLRSLPVVF